MRALLLTVLLLPCLALAQAKTLKDKEEIKFNEIERGFTMGGAAGYWGFFNSPGNTRPYAGGLTARLDIGYDFGERVVGGIMLQVASNHPDNGSSYLGTTGTSASGDYSELMPGIAVKVNLVGFNDNQDVKRLWVYVRGSAAAGLYFPKTLIDKFDLMIQGGVGIEYFTKLRHFALGLEANAVIMALTGTFGLSVTPTLRYSF
jgi:hypothetical protein